MNKLAGIEELQKRIGSINKNSFLKRAKDLLSKEQLDLINSAMLIINKYQDPNWSSKDLLEIQTDVVCLQTAITKLIVECGDLMSLQESDISSIATVRSKIRLDAKKAKRELEEEGNPIRCTIEDIKDLANTMTADVTQSLEDTRLVGNHLKFIYFSMKDQAQLLEKAVNRFWQRGEQYERDILSRQSTREI